LCRYPDDTLDRLWDAKYSTGANAIRTSNTVTGTDSDEYVPVSVVQTSFVADSIANFWSYKPALAADGRPHSYYAVLFFAEVDPRVNASGRRVLDITINGRNFFQGLDVYDQAGLDNSYEIYSPNPLGPYSSVVVNVTGTPTSVFPPFIAGTEILQLLDVPRRWSVNVRNLILIIEILLIIKMFANRPLVNLVIRRQLRGSAGLGAPSPDSWAAF
jgi:hypothetical protein